MQGTFEVLDYIIFALTLSVSAGISFYFGCFGNKQKHAKEYLYGSGKLTSIPIGLSLLSSAVSALAVIGAVQEIYIFGTQFLMACIGLLFGLAVTWKLILPVFCGNLNLKAPYEYFERRYNSNVRLLLSVMYVLHLAMFSSIILYTSTISFSETTGIKLYICTTVIGATCAIYTMLGGFSGVIWTDVLQTVLMLSSCIFILFKGLSVTGGFVNVLYEADKGQRIQLFNFDPNPFTRLTVWSVVLGMCVINVAHSSCAASGIQRFMALNTETQAKTSSSIQVFGLILVYLIATMISLCIYVFYKDCDPIKNKKIDNATQLLSYFINEINGNTIGFTGLFTAGLLSAGLSSMSAELNTVSGIIYYDILQKIFKFPENEIRAALIMKGIIIIYALIYIILAPLLQNFKYIYQLGLTICSWTYGAKFGVMILATTFPKSNSWGAICGVISGLFTIAWISINALYLDTVTEFALPVSVNNCSKVNDNFTHIIHNLTVSVLDSKPENTFSIYKLSFMYYPVLGAFVTITVGMIVSYVTGVNDVNKMDPRLIIPYLRSNSNGKQRFTLRNIFIHKFNNDNNVKNDIDI